MIFSNIKEEFYHQWGQYKQEYRAWWYSGDMTEYKGFEVDFVLLKTLIIEVIQINYSKFSNKQVHFIYETVSDRYPEKEKDFHTYLEFLDEINKDLIMFNEFNSLL